MVQIVHQAMYSMQDLYQCDFHISHTLVRLTLAPTTTRLRLERDVAEAEGRCVPRPSAAPGLPCGGGWRGEATPQARGRANDKHMRKVHVETV